MGDFRMSKIREMIDSIASDNFDGARDALKTTVAQYMHSDTKAEIIDTTDTDENDTKTETE